LAVPQSRNIAAFLTFGGVVPVKYWRPGNLPAPALEAFARMPYSEVGRLTSFCQGFCQRPFLPEKAKSYGRRKANPRNELAYSGEVTERPKVRHWKCPILNFNHKITHAGQL
jgi:hypothetical protein